MIKNYFKVSLRTLISQKGYTFINLLGLTLGLATTLLIILYVWDELSYDKFHPNASRTYRICVDVKFLDQEFIAPFSSPPIGSTLVNSYPDIINYCRIHQEADDSKVSYGENTFSENGIGYVDSTFFQVFNGFRLIKGNANSILNRKFEVVLTESTAKRYFGDQDAMGKRIKIGKEEQDYEVVGVMADFPVNSHISFDMISSFSSLPFSQIDKWAALGIYTYIVLQDGLNPEDVDRRLSGLVSTHALTQLEQVINIKADDFVNLGNRFMFFLQPLTEIHLGSDMQFEMQPGGNRTMVYSFMLIAVFIIIIASINYMNLATARSSRRGMEVGIRKIFGSSADSLMGQFLAESFILTFLALLLAVGLVNLALPFFNNIAGKQLDISAIPVAGVVPWLLLILVVVGVGAGSYPAFYLSKLSPVKMLKMEGQSSIKNKYLRNIMVTIQFTISIGLLIATFTVFSQISFFQNKDLGYDPSNILVIKGIYNIPQGQSESFINELKSTSGIVSVTRSSFVPAMAFGNAMIQIKGTTSNEVNMLNYNFTCTDFADVHDLRVEEGRFFNTDYTTDTTAAVLNKSAVTALSFEGSPIGRIVLLNALQPLTIVGVVEDFNYNSLHKKVNPLIMINTNHYSYISVKYNNAHVAETLEHVDKLWKEFVPEESLDYYFLEETLSNQYSSEKKMGTIFASFSVLSVFIASLGLLGLSAFSTAQRTREIGLRKVMGASTKRIIWLFLKEINGLFLISTIIAWPLAWDILGNWLDNFAFRINLSLFVFMGASIIAYMVAVLTVGYQVIKAANINPAVTLKYE